MLQKVKLTKFLKVYLNSKSVNCTNDSIIAVTTTV